MGEIEEIAEAMCDFYCKYPEYIMDEDVMKEICERCPLNKLFQNADEDDLK